VSDNEESAIPQSKPDLQTFGRERHAPGAYYLDLSAVEMFTLNDNGQPSTFGEIYFKLTSAKSVSVSERHIRTEAVFITDSGEVKVSGESDRPYISGLVFVINILRELVALAADGINPSMASWFYYGHDWSRDADELFLFFVVHNGKIVRDSFSFMHCDPRVLVKSKADIEPIWHAEPHERQAWETYWYRKFYTETLTGQLMVLRPDEPILYNYARAERDVTRDVGVVTLIKIYGLLWVAVPLLAAIAFPMLWPYMAFLAAALMVDLLWRAWATRKIGQH
jgi:hypothetical protein